MEALDRAFGKVLEAFALLSCALVGAITLMICADVLLRNVPLIPGVIGLAWSNELSETGLYLVTMFSAPWLLREGRHIRVDIVLRATRVVDRLLIAVAASDGKEPAFALDERVQMVREEVAGLGPDLAKRIEVRSFSSLLVHFAEEIGAKLIVRGLRAVSDFEYEFQMTGMNQRLKPEIETVFLMASERHQFISSRFVKEICRLGGDVGAFVSPAIERRLKARYAQR